MTSFCPKGIQIITIPANAILTKAHNPYPAYTVDHDSTVFAGSVLVMTKSTEDEMFTTKNCRGAILSDWERKLRIAASQCARFQRGPTRTELDRVVSYWRENGLI